MILENLKNKYNINSGILKETFKETLKESRSKFY